jgi:hypothetical protein
MARNCKRKNCVYYEGWTTNFHACMQPDVASVRLTTINPVKKKSWSTTLYLTDAKYPENELTPVANRKRTNLFSFSYCLPSTNWVFESNLLVIGRDISSLKYFCFSSHWKNADSIKMKYTLKLIGVSKTLSSYLRMKANTSNICILMPRARFFPSAWWSSTFENPILKRVILV